MKSINLLSWSTKGYILFSTLSLGYVSVLSIISPQSTMDLVNVTLPSSDAISSILGIYGGVGLLITGTLIYGLNHNIYLTIKFLMAFWGLYALSRLITYFTDGPLGDFGMQWLIIESFFFMLAVVLLLFKGFNYEK